MLKLIMTLSTLVMSMSANALSVSSCAEYELTLNMVTDMKVYSNGRVKLFAIDMIEPAGAPVGVAVSIDRGDRLSTAESYCRFVSGLTDVDLTKIKADYDGTKNAFTFTLPVSYHIPDQDNFKRGTLTLEVSPGAKAESRLVQAKLK